jgi:Fe-S cluster biosynthesis and repair protein YggX
MAERFVKCAKLGRELPGLPKPPFSGALGQRIFENISQQAMALWDAEAEALMKKGMNLADAQARKEIMRRMEQFLFEETVAAPPPSSERMVTCVKFGKEMPALEKPPFPGTLGQRIFENVSEQGWGLWDEQAKIVLNHYGLSLADPEARKFMLKQMEEFFFGEGAALPADWVPPGQGGKGAPAAASKGGAPVAQSK